MGLDPRRQAARRFTVGHLNEARTVSKSSAGSQIGSTAFMLPLSVVDMMAMLPIGRRSISIISPAC
jgi:hypothetical protein